MANSISASHSRLHGSKRFRADEESTKNGQQSLTNAQRNDSDCSSVASSSGCSSSNSNDQNQVQPPPSKRRVSFNAQPRIYQSSVAPSQKLGKELNNNLSFRESFGEKLNKTETSVNPETVSPCTPGKSKITPKLFTDVLKEDAASFSPLSQTFSHGVGPQMTPQRPLGESLFYRNNRNASFKPTTATPSFNASIFGSPVFLPTPSNPHIRTRNSSLLSQNTGGGNSQVPLSESAMKILKRLEQPVTHTEIYRMRKLGSLKTFSPMASPKPKDDEEIPSAPLPSFSFLSSKRVVPPKTSPPSFKFASTPSSKSLVDPLKSSLKNPGLMGKPSVSKATNLDDDQDFTFMMPTPRKFGFESGPSDTATSKKSLSFVAGKTTSTKPSDEAQTIGQSKSTRDPKNIESKIGSKPIVSECSAPSLSLERQDKLTQLFKPKSGSWSCDVCLVTNKSSDDTCVACQTRNPLKPTTSSSSKPPASCDMDKQNKLALLFKPKSDSWSCDICLVTNKSSDDSCVACQTPNPSKPTTSSISKLPTSCDMEKQNKLALLFKPKSDSWSCDICLVTNKSSDDSCVACQTPNPSKPTTSSISKLPTSCDMEKQNKLALLFKPKSDSWSCDICLVTNKSSDDSCVACQTPNPSKPAENSSSKSSTSLAPASTLFGTTVKGPEISQTPKFAFGSGSIDKVAQPFAFSAAPAAASFFNPPTESKNQGSAKRPTFTFGSANPPESKDLAKTPAFTFGGANPTFKPLFGSQKESTFQQNGTGFTFGSIAPPASSVTSSFQPSLTAGSTMNSGFNFNFSVPSAKLQNSSNDSSAINAAGDYANLSNGNSSEEKKLIPSFNFSAPSIANAVNSGSAQESGSVLKPVFGGLR